MGTFSFCPSAPSKSRLFPGPWSDHGTQWYSCNRYDDKAAIDARDAQSKSRISLERYLHVRIKCPVLHVAILTSLQYYNRWANHEQSARLSADLYVKTEKKMEEMQMTTDLTWIEVQFAKKAVEEVLRCRMTLKWTYAMAYYLDKSNAKELFEDNQRFVIIQLLFHLFIHVVYPAGISRRPSRICQNF